MAASFPRPAPPAPERMTISSFRRREAHLRRVRDFERRPEVVAPTCRTPADARLGEGPALACALPSGRVVKRKARNATRWDVVGRLGPAQTDADLENVAVSSQPRGRQPEEEDVVRMRVTGVEGSDSGEEEGVSEATPPAQLLDTLTNAEMRRFFPHLPITHRYAIAEVAEILSVVVAADGSRNLLVNWVGGGPVEEVRASDIRGGEKRIAQFLERQARERVDTQFYSCEPTGNTRLTAGGELEIEVVWDVDGEVGWTKESAFL
jgi:hypothetical protein